MAVTITSTNSTFSPSGNQNIFQVSSNDSSIVYFKVEIFQAGTSNVVWTSNIYTTPEIPQGSYIDVSRVLDNLVKYKFHSSPAINYWTNGYYAVPSASFGYTIKFTEYVLSGGSIVAGANTTTSTHYVWSAKYDTLSFQSYFPQTTVINTIQPAKFLTYKGNNTKVNSFSYEALSFLQNDATPIVWKVRTYDAGDNVLNTYTETLTINAGEKLFTLLVSPRQISYHFTFSFAGIAYYDIWLEDGSGGYLMETRRYYVTDLDCSIEPVNLIWVNSLGGADGFQFRNVQETINYNRTSIKKNPFKIDDSGFYRNTDNVGKIFNPTDEIINVHQSGSYSVTSGFISDREAYFLSELFKSKQVYVEVNHDLLVPIQITNTSYTIPRRKLSNNYSTITVNYTMPDDIIPPVMFTNNASYPSAQILTTNANMDII